MCLTGHTLTASWSGVHHTNTSPDSSSGSMSVSFWWWEILAGILHIGMRSREFIQRDMSYVDYNRRMLDIGYVAVEIFSSGTNGKNMIHGFILLQQAIDVWPNII